MHRDKFPFKAQADKFEALSSNAKAELEEKFPIITSVLKSEWLRQLFFGDNPTKSETIKKI